LIAGNLAFVSFGQIAIIGEVCCLVGALVSVPAILVSLRTKSSAEMKDLPRNEAEHPGPAGGSV
jgi:predicted RND superfamily exporter protein